LLVNVIVPVKEVIVIDYTVSSSAEIIVCLNLIIKGMKITQNHSDTLTENPQSKHNNNNVNVKTTQLRFNKLNNNIGGLYISTLLG
jgi:hypothetical protein